MKLIAKATPMGTWKTVKKSIDRLNVEGKKKIQKQMGRLRTHAYRNARDVKHKV